mmetsp:Transcript_6588/g.9575  ORF Transcript_6588/g.9575 Transcript_6588/m.9575 type:complete len:214 (-) Transcript_6588:64-705(-)
MSLTLFETHEVKLQEYLDKLNNFSDHIATSTNESSKLDSLDKMKILLKRSNRCLNSMTMESPEHPSIKKYKRDVRVWKDKIGSLQKELLIEAPPQRSIPSVVVEDDHMDDNETRQLLQEGTQSLDNSIATIQRTEDIAIGALESLGLQGDILRRGRRRIQEMNGDLDISGRSIRSMEIRRRIISIGICVFFFILVVILVVLLYVFVLRPVVSG